MSRIIELICAIAAAFSAALPLPAAAQTTPGAPAPATAASQRLSAQQLESVVAPVAHLGPRTAETASKITTYAPDASWHRAED